MGLQLFAKNVQGQTIQLDIYDSDPVKINLAVEEVTNAQQTAGNFTRTFRLPHTRKNQSFFQGVFDVNSVVFNATRNAPAWIQSDGFYFTSGNIRLTNVYLSGRQDQVEYEVLFMGETSDFSGAVGDGFLCELDFSEYAHNQTYSVIRDSWNAATSVVPGTGLFGGNVLYPLVEQGYSYNNDGVIQENSLTTGYTGSFTNSTKGLLQGQLKPALRVDAIWRKIFSTAGYGFTGAFFDSPRWKALYMLSENVVRSIAEPDNTCYADIGPTPYTPISPYQYVIFNNSPTIYQDPGGNVNINNGYYTCSGTGLYGFSVTYEYSTNVINPSGGFIYMEMFNTSTGASLGSNTQFVPNGFDNQIVNATFLLALNTGQSVGVRATFQTGGYPQGVPVQYFDVNNIEFRCTAAPSIVNPTAFLPCNFKKMDFIKSITDRFKLIFEPSKEFEKTFTVTPWVDWIAQGNKKDWSQKLDGSKDLKVSPLFYTQKRELVYNDQEDSDYPNYAYTQDNKKPYGQYKLDSGIQLLKDTQEIKGIFAPTPLVSIASATGGTAGVSFLIPSLAKDNAPTSALGKREPIIPKPRLVFYNGKRTAPVTWYLKDDSNANQAQTVYPLVSSFEVFPPNITTLDLHWQNDPYLFDTAKAGVTGRSGNTVWNEYWEDWYNTYYSPYGRIAEGYFVLNDDDVSNIKFNDNIFAANAWWNPTKVVDYEIGGNKATKVQLIKIGDVSVVTGFTGATGGTGGATGGCTGTCQQWAVCNNNFDQLVYNYVDCYSQLPVIGVMPGQVCQLICSCSTPYSVYPNFEIYLQGSCPGFTGATGGGGGGVYGVANPTKLPVRYKYTPVAGEPAVDATVLPFKTANVCSVTAPYDIIGGGTAISLSPTCGGTGGDRNDDVFVASLIERPFSDWAYNLKLGQSENGVTFEPVIAYDLTGADSQMFLNDFPDPNQYANLTYLKQAPAEPGTIQFLQLYVGEDLLRSIDVTYLEVGRSMSIQTPTPVNGIGYTLQLLNIIGE